MAIAMTEREWLTSDDPARMLRLRRTDCCGCLWVDNGDGTVSLCSGASPCGQCDNGPITPYAPWSERKLRLFACACCRQPEVWGRLTDDATCEGCYGSDAPPLGAGYANWRRSECPNCHGTGRVNRSRRAVEVAERYADGLATADELSRAYIGEVPYCVGELEEWCAREAAMISPVANATKAALLRDIAGNPFRPVTLPRPNCFECRNTRKVQAGQLDCPHCPCPWFTWGDGAIPKMARAIYEHRTFDQLPILADALEDARCEPQRGRTVSDVLADRRNAVAGGCCNRFADNMGCNCLAEAEPDGILAHLRSGGPHTRGCWVLDLLLGKE